MRDASQTFEIAIKNCNFYAYHGVYEEEKKLGQNFYVDAVLQVQAVGDLQDDQIEGTVHYGEAYALIEKIVTQTRRDLIETLAMDIAAALCDEFSQILSAKVNIRKPNAPINGIFDYVEASVSCAR